MNDNAAVIDKFYQAFKSLDYKTMCECYHPEATFQDAVFGPLNVEETRTMWEMLCRNAREFSLEYGDVWADESEGGGRLTASYLFSKTGRCVINPIIANFQFKDGKIVRHYDQFSLWNWARQALGPVGFFLGWLPFFQQKIRRGAKKNLDTFICQKQRGEV